MYMFHKKYWLRTLALCIIISMSACKKMIDSPDGTANIYLTAAINNLYAVPGIPANYMADKAAKKLHIPVYMSRSGLQGAGSFSVDVAADNAAAQKIIDDGLVSADKAIVAPADVYELPATYTAGKEHNGFDVLFDASKLNAYLGKQLVLTVRISNPSQFQLNEKLSALNIVLDVDAVMLGTKVEVTDTYIKNSGHPFIASTYDGVRRGVLADWTTSAEVKNFEGGTLGGFDNYGDGGFMSMERYSSPQILNGKIYQSFDLPAGKYEMTAAFLDFSVKEQAYIAAAAGSSLPDVADIDQALGAAPFTSPTVEFFLAEPQRVTIGVVAYFMEDQQYFRLDKFRLYHYKGLWD